MKQNTVIAFLTLAFLATGCQGGPAKRPALSAKALNLPIVDAHTQIDGETDMNVVIATMDRAGIGRALLSARFGRKPDDILALAKAHPDRITATARTKTKNYLKGFKGTEFFRNSFTREIAAGEYGALAEVILWHDQKGNKAGKVVIAPDHPRVQVYVDAAVKNDWSFIFHIEFGGAGSDREPFMKKMKAVLRQHPDHPMALIHMGQIDDPAEARRLIEDHPNLHFITSHCNPLTHGRPEFPWANLFDGDRLHPTWSKLMIDHPDRFVLAFDNVFPDHWGDYYVDQANLWRRALTDLPEPVAHAIAHKNAERLWKLPPTQSTPPTG